MPITVHELASLTEGRVHGDGNRIVEAARPLQEAGPADIAFLENDRHFRHLKAARAGTLVVSGSIAERLLSQDSAHTFTLIETADPLAAFIRIVQHLQPPLPPPAPGVALQAAIDPSARVGPGGCIMPFAVVGAGSTIGVRCRLHPHVVIGRNCRLGDDVTLHPGVVIYDNSVIGNRVVIHAGSVIGSDGFGYRFVQGSHVKVPQLGNVEIGDDVEIGAGTTIDRGTFQSTRIGAGTKIDNLVQIAHNCRIGRHNLLVSQVGIAGSCTTGDYVVMAGQVGVADHVNVGDGVLIGAGSGVPSDIPAGQRMLGYPVAPERETKRYWLTLTELPALARDVRRIKQKLGLSDSARQATEGEKKAG